MSLLKRERGQVFVLTALSMTVLLGMAALAIDVGSWWLADRAAQGAADASALAGAQKLPVAGDADSTARTYWSKNGDHRSNISADAIDVCVGEFSDVDGDGDPDPPACSPADDTITVEVRRQADGFFAKVFGIDSVRVAAVAQARIFAPLELKDVAPIAIYKDEACIVSDPSCFGQPVTLGFAEDDPYDPTKSKFGLLDLDRDGSAGAGDMKEWLENGYPDALPIDTVYPPANGEKNGIKQQLEDAADEQKVLLFPVYDSATVAGYHVIGWAAFVIDDVVTWNGHEHEFTGHFVTFIAADLAAGGPNPDPNSDFGVHVITLTK
jgi:Putative Flp pilus-assembly TadE/G-like